tara:strand:+ start:5719 stop:6909 length:1191 start_codon:yes stop_codon:yes gene_type:complete
MPHNPRHGADPGVVIGGGPAQFSGNPFVSQPAQFSGNPFVSPVSVGFGQGQVDPGLAAAAGIGSTQSFTGPFVPSQQQQTGGGITTLASDSGGKPDDKPEDKKDDQPEDKKDDETLIQKIQGVLTGDEIKQLSPAQLAEAQRLIGLYQPLNLNPFQLRSVMVKNLFEGGLGKDQTYTDMEGNRVDPDDVVFRLTDDGQQMFFIDEDGKEQPVRRSREGVLDLLGSDTIQSLERFAPDLIFGTDIGVMPATSGGLLTVANNPVAQAVRDATGKITGYITADGREISKEQGDKYNESIFAARAELDRMGKNTTTGTSNQGIMAASPAFPGLPVPRPPVTPPGTTPPAQPPIPAPIAGITPFNINQFYASLPTSTYSQQGVMSPNLAQFYQNLGLFPRV